MSYFIIPLNWILTLSVLILGLGLYGILRQRSMLRILLATELILNAAMINFVAFSMYHSPVSLSGQIFVIVIIGIAAAELLIGMVLLMELYKEVGTIDVSLANQLKGVEENGQNA